MKKIISSLFLLLAFLINLYGQSSRITNDFIVSDNNNPSTFLQEKTKLFVNGTKGGIYTWWDYRFGEMNWFAQKVDSNGTKTGNNFQIMNDLDICFAPDNSYLVLGENFFYSSIFDSYYTVSGKVYFGNGSSLPDFYITGGILPWCGTGYLGLHHTLARTNNHYIYFHSGGGPVYFFKYNFLGELVRQMTPQDSLPINTYDITCISNKQNDYALFSCQVASSYSDGGIYATLFSSRDSFLAKNVLIKPLSVNAYTTQSNHLRATLVMDSMYQVFWVSSDFKSLFYWNVNRDGSQILTHAPISLLNYDSTSSNLYKIVSNMSLTPINNGEYSILVSIRESRDRYKKDFNTLVNFNEHGHIISVFSDSVNVFELSHQMFKTWNHQLLIPANIENDASQKKLNNFTLVDSLKLNDELVGSNEQYPVVRRINNNEMFVTYQDEDNFIGKKLDNNGNLLTNEIILENRDLKFYTDGWSVASWYEEEPASYNRRVGISIYDPNFNLFKKITLNSFQLFNSNVACQILSDSNIVTAFYDGDSLWLRTYNRSGLFLNERLAGTGLYNNGISLFIENQNSFLLSTNAYTQMFNNQPAPISPVYSRPPYYYLGNLKMLETSVDEYGYVSGQILDLNGDSVSSKFFLCSSFSDFNFERINNEIFAILFKYSNKIYVKSFSTAGIQLRDSLSIHSDIPAYRKTPDMSINDSKVLFTWADLRNQIQGYDIYCSIFNLSDITSVNSTTPSFSVDEFVLFQNYPNPFNPSTKISYSIPCVGARCIVPVQLKIYDVLGNEIATLVNEYKLAGSYNVEFRIENSELSSGVYFYQLKAGDYFQTKKMIILR